MLGFFGGNGFVFREHFFTSGPVCPWGIDWEARTARQEEGDCIV